MNISKTFFVLWVTLTMNVALMSPIFAENNGVRREVQEISVKLSSETMMKMILIPAGKFMMGSPSSENLRSRDEDPQHEVTIKEFYLGKYEVTQGEWKAVMGNNPSFFKGDQGLPVESVSWDECQSFIKKLNEQKNGYVYRLPSEAEWEYACRAGTKTPFSFGETITAEQVNYDADYPYGMVAKSQDRKKTTVAGSLPANAWGLHDMHGNVWEWCQDGWHKDYNKAPSDGSAWEKDSDGRHVLRGGSWGSLGNYCRSAFRLANAPSAKLDYLGLRLSAAPDPK